MFKASEIAGSAFIISICVYPVEYRHPLVEVSIELVGGDGDVVEVAEAEGLVPLRVVAGRPNQTKPVPQATRSN